MKLPKSRAWREAKGLTRQELAEAAGLSPQTLAGYESGREARPNNARKLAAALGVEVAELMEESQLPKDSAPREDAYDPRASELRRENYLSALIVFCHKQIRRWEKEWEERASASSYEFFGWGREVMATIHNFSSVVFEGGVFSHGVGVPSKAEEDYRSVLLRGMGRMLKLVDQILDEWDRRAKAMEDELAAKEQHAVRDYYDQEFKRIVAENFSEAPEPATSG